VLTEIDRILDELDLEHRSRRLMEELDRAALQRRARYTRLGPLGGFVHGERPGWWPRRRPGAFRARRG
jgi:hypothetical protein